jgi:hypothetical protein
VSGRLVGFWLAALACALGAGACSKPKSFIVLDLKTGTHTEQISGVTSVVVKASQGTSFSTTLTYPVNGAPLVINDVNVNNLSVSFAGARSGPVTLSVLVSNGAGCLVGEADGFSIPIRQGDIVSEIVVLTPHFCSVSDGGVDGQETDAFPGCDPASPLASCAPGETCQVNCMTNAGECTAGGTGGPGAPCMSNKDCAPGSQCFDYSGTGCAVKVCLRFCHDDSACPGADGGASPGADAGTGGDGSAADAGAADGAATPPALSSGPASVCQGVVPCGSVITAYHTCTFGCDPRQAAAAAGTSRCPAGLSCLVIGTMDQVDCACAEPSRKGTDGTDCTGGTDCAPGFICNLMADTKKCRGICRCDAKNMTCTAPNECGGGRTCTALTNETTFGVCL